MKISIIGAGVVGKATADCFLRFGHSISCVDVDAERLQALKNEGFDVLEKATDADVHFICTSDPGIENALAMLSDVTGLIAIRSTITPGTTRSLMEKYNRHICFVPEFLRASTALQDELNPWRIVIGECCPTHSKFLEELYRPLLAPIIIVDTATAEMVKLTCNTYLAMLISFFNEIHEICNRIGVQSHEVGRIAAMDPRISTYGATQHSKPYTGVCLPKDIRNLIKFSQVAGVDPILLKAVEQVNENVK